MERDNRICWVEFIRAAPATESPQKKAKTGQTASQLRPIAAFMRALDAKLGPMFDKIVLQVCAHNKHAQQRFAQYDFERNDKYDDETRKGRGPKIHLMGMVKQPKGEAVKAALKRRRMEAAERQQQQADQADKSKEIRDLVGERKQPGRAASRDVVYEEPEDPGITIDDICLVR